MEGREVDARSDVFSLGVLLHEAATGSRPFVGSSSAALISSILRDPAPPIEARRDDLPGAFGRLIGKCLEKTATDASRRRETSAMRSMRFGANSRRERHQPARLDLTRPRRRPSTPSGSTRARRSIVVLPFANLSPDADNAYFSDGLTEELISDLAKVNALQVTSRTSSMQLKGTTKDLRTIGQDLGVRTCSKAACGKRGTACASRHSSSTSRRMPRSGRTAQRIDGRHLRGAGAGCRAKS